MNPLLEVNPGACIFLVGPQIAACYATRYGGRPPPTYRAVVEAGILFAQGVQSFASEDRKSQHQLLGNVYDHDPTAAAHKITEILKQNGCYAEWLRKTFGAADVQYTPEASSNSALATVKHLLNLQKKGALLVYTHYDTILDTIAGTAPIVMENDTNYQKWVNKEMLGFLHLHGVYSQPESVRLTCDESLSKSSNAAVAELFRKRLVILIGYDREYFDPLIPCLFKKVMYPEESTTLRYRPILLTTTPGQALPNFLELGISQKEMCNLGSVILAGSEKNFTIGRGLERSLDGVKVQAFLLFDEKQSFRKLGDIIYQQSKSGEIYVRRDALTVHFDERILYGNLITYGGNGLRHLWDLVFAEDSPLHGKGLIALGLQNAAIVWTKRKPGGLGNVTGINSVHTYSMSKSQATKPSLPLHLPITNNNNNTVSPGLVVPTLVTRPPLSLQLHPNTLARFSQAASPMLASAFTPSSPFIFTPLPGSENLTSPLLAQTHQHTTQQANAPTPTLPKPHRLNVAGPPELLASISLHMNEPAVEHTVEYVDQLKTQKSDEMRKGHSPFVFSKVESDPDQKSRQDSFPPLSKFADLAQFSQRVSSFCRVGEQTSTEKPSSKEPTTPSPSMPATTHVQNIFISPSPQTLISQPAMPFVYPNPSIPGYYVLVNPLAPQKPSLMACPSSSMQPPSLLSQTTNTGVSQFYYMLPSGLNVSAASEDKSTTSKIESSSQQQQRTLKRCQSPTSSSRTPSPKRRKRSASLPNVKQPFYGAISSKGDYQTAQSLQSMDNHLPDMRHQGEDSETERESDHHSGSDTETATSDTEDAPKRAEHSTTVSNQSTQEAHYKGHVQLWEFLLHLLLTPDHGSIIQWTGNGYEFCIVNPEAVAQLWGAQKKKPRMTYEKLSRALRYYHTRGIMDRVNGKRLTFKFAFDIQKYIIATRTASK